tara:strand:+ start:3333 stop:3911 length:579 start_codon:yes stop_codon:yes gene_type:complete
MSSDESFTFTEAVEEAQAQQRECGSCKACCKVIGVPEMESPPGKWCSKVVEDKSSACGGCTIYEKRPESCREFVCVWASGRADNIFRDDTDTPVGMNERPDNFGAVVFNFEGPHGDPVIGIAETKVNGLGRRHVRKLIDRIHGIGFDVMYMSINGDPLVLQGSGAWKNMAGEPELDSYDIVDGGIWVPRGSS